MTHRNVLPSPQEPLFSIHTQLSEDAVDPTIPDQPFVDSSEESVEDFLRSELETPILNELYPHLWLVAAQMSHRVDALHLQKSKGRRIAITEDPKLHLVWHSDVIFIKPIPRCLLNYHFWTRHLCHRADSNPREASTKAQSVLGYLRTYALLIRHPSDFHLAVESKLVPEDVNWNQFARFIEGFRHVKDDQVSPRYCFGQLRLTRLNWAVRIFRPSSSQWWYYHEMYWNTGAYMERFLAPLLFVFGSLAIVLTAMQVLVAVPDGSIMDTSQWTAMVKTSWGFSIAMISLVVTIWLAFVGGFVLLLICQAAFAARTLIRTEKSRKASRGIQWEEAGLSASRLGGSDGTANFRPHPDPHGKGERM